MARNTPTFEECVSAVTEVFWALKNARSSLIRLTSSETVLPKKSAEDLRHTLWETSWLNKKQTDSLIWSSEARKLFIRNYDQWSTQKLASAITAGKDIKDVLAESTKVKTDMKMMQAAMFLIVYEASVAWVPIYKIVNQIFGVDVNPNTLVIYDGKSKTLLDAELKFVDETVEKQLASLKEECKKATKR